MKESALNQRESGLGDSQNSADDASIQGQPEGRLDSWKKIAKYLGRDVSTVQRWERRESMPVHRHLHDKSGTVFAFRSELDTWWESRRAGLARNESEARNEASEAGSEASAAPEEVSAEPPAPGEPSASAPASSQPAAGAFASRRPAADATDGAAASRQPAGGGADGAAASHQPAGGGVASPQSAAGATRRLKPVRVALITAVLIAIGLALYSIRPDHPGNNPLSDAKFTRLADFGGVGQAVAVSRDGRFVAFVGEREGQTDAWLSEIGSGAYRNLTQGEIRELINPSIRTIGFSKDASLVSIWTRRPDGSQPGDVNIIAAPTAGGALRPYLPGIAEFDWSHDGSSLVYHTTAPGDPLFIRESGQRQTRQAEAGPRDSAQHVPGQSGPGQRGPVPPALTADRRVYTAPAGVHCHFPLWSPDDAFIYFARGIPPDDWDIWRVRPSGSGLERITHHNSRVSFPVMLDRHTLVYLATDADGSGPWMYSLDVEERVSRRVSTGLESYTSLAASGDGRRLVATIANPRMSVWRISLEGAPGSAAASVSTPLLVQANGVAPRFVQGSLLYISWRGERQGVWSKSGGNTHEIWGDDHSRIVSGLAPAPDGKQVAFVVATGGKTSLYVMDSEGGHARVVAGSLPLLGNLAWAPDGQSIVSAVLHDGEPRLWRIFLNGEAPIALVSEYSIDPVWSPDGRFLVYSGADVGTTFPLRAAAADGRAYPLPPVMLTRGARRVAFFHDAQTLVILNGDMNHKDFRVLDLRSGTQRGLANLPADFVIHDFDIAADGTGIVFDRAEMSSDLALIERPPQ